MIAKVIAYADDRATALARLDDALARTVVLGVDTNIAFLRTLCRDARVVEGDLDTGLIETLLPLEADRPSIAQLTAARSAVAGVLEPLRTSTLWRELPGWRLGADSAGDTRFTVLTDDDVAIDLESTDAARSQTGVHAAVDADGAVWVAERGRTVRLRPLDRRQRMRRRLAARDARSAATEPEGRAPMPGSVVAVHVSNGDAVSAGDPLVAIEAMKMEHQVLAPHDGVVQLLVAVGDQVRRDQPVARVTTEES